MPNLLDLSRRQPSALSDRTVLGILNHDGAMADFVGVPVVNLHDIPSEIDDRAAVFIAPPAAPFCILEQVDVSHKTTVAVVGDGKLGILSPESSKQQGRAFAWSASIRRNWQRREKGSQ